MTTQHGMNFNLPTGQVTLVSLASFIELIPTNDRRPNKDSFVIFESWREYWGYPDLTMVETNGFETKVHSTLNLMELFRIQGLSGIPTRNYHHKSFMECLYESNTEAMKENGYPTHLVRLAPRLYLLANPHTFCIFRNEKGSAVVCFSGSKNAIFHVGKNTFPF